MNVEPSGSERERPNEKAMPQRVLYKNAPRSQIENAAFSPKTLPHLPSAVEIMAAPEEHLLLALTRNSEIGFRNNRDRWLCVERVRTGAMLVDDLHAPFCPDWVPAEALDHFCAHNNGSETSAHRLLKLHARLLAEALNPFAMIESEAPLRPGLHAGRPDLTAWDAYGRALVIECGATPGLTVLRRLDEGASWVMVLPFAGLQDDSAIRGWVFRSPETPALPTPSALTLRAVWRSMLAECLGTADISPRTDRIGACA